jgi:hypothetical protein
MIQLSLPTRVTCASWLVPTLNEQNSRIVLRSPISSRVGSASYFLSCGLAPIEQNWKISLSRPMRSDAGTVADLDVLADQRIGPDADVGTELRARMDDGGRVDHSVLIAHISSASAASSPSTLARALYL